MNIEQMKQVVENAPDGATHYDIGCDEYLDYEVDTVYMNGAWINVNIDAYAEPHDLSDLRTIVRQAEEIERLRSFIIRYRYQIKGGEAMQKYIDERVLNPPKGEDDE